MTTPTNTTPAPAPFAVQTRLDFSRISLASHSAVKGSGILANKEELDGMCDADYARGCCILRDVARGDLGRVRRQLLQSKPQEKDVDHQRTGTNTLLHFRNADRRTILHLAASEGHLEICKFLLEDMKATFLINRSDRFGGSPLDDAHRHHQLNIVQYLKQHGATTGSANKCTNLITASADGDIDEVLLLLHYQDEYDINQGDYEQRTSLALAAQRGYLDIVRLLHQSGASLNVTDKFGRTPLDEAVDGKHMEVERYLGQHGAQRGPKKITKQHSDVEDVEQFNLRVDMSELEMLDRIGAGAFGQVFKCRYRGMLVAAKCIKNAQIQTQWARQHVQDKIRQAAAQGDDDLMDEMIRMADENDDFFSDRGKAMALHDFEKEIAVLKALRHPNIVLLLAYSTTPEYEVTLCELMHCSLLDVLRYHQLNHTRLNPAKQIQYAVELASGMLYLHTCQPMIIHRDIKPANLLVDKAGTLKVSDFGFAKLLPPPPPHALTNQGSFQVEETDSSSKAHSFAMMTGETGTYRYMAPEVFRRESTYTESVDMYSFAMVLYYLLDGRPPWPEMSGLKAAQKAAHAGERPDLDRKWDSRLCHLLSECWRDKPAARPSFGKIVEILTEYQDDVYPPEPINQLVLATSTSKKRPSAKSKSSSVAGGCQCVIL